jgi:DNA-binding beta-propeller fold protein YncE
VGLRLLGHVELPAHAGPGGFDHAAVDRRAQRVYVAHTANDAVDVIDATRDVYAGSLGGLPAVAGVLLAEEARLGFTSNRGEDTVGIFPLDPGRRPSVVGRLTVGRRPNGLAYDPARGTLLAANVGDPGEPGSCSLSVVDGGGRTLRASVPVPGRTRWAVHDPATDAFDVNIA